MKRRQSRKGSVLLSVVCFTTVLTILATTALSMSHVANKTSNKNVRSTQAEITAENYLVQYLSTFGGVYDDLNTIAAGGTETAPKVIDVTMNKGPGTTVQNSQGDCKIYVYKKGSGVYVKSVATYAGEEETSVAYFNGAVATPYESNSTIETFNGVTGGDKGVGYHGDIHLEGNPNATVTLQNSQSVIQGNVYTNSNILFSDNTNTAILDSNENTAPTLTAEGYIILNQGSISTSVGKRDGLGNLPGSADYDAATNGLGNKDGYILSDMKVLFGKDVKIGSSTHPIDVYSHGVYFGSVPDYMSDYITITTGVTGADKVDNNPLTEPIYGNIYCYKGTETGQDGCFVANKINTNTIKGDLVVDGDIYIGPNCGKLVIDGNLYCTGNIIYKYTQKIYWPSYEEHDVTETATIDADGNLTGDISNISAKLSATKMINGLPGDARSVMPDVNYDPSKYDPVTSPNPIRSSPSAYQNKTVNDMFRDTSFTDAIKTSSGNKTLKDAYTSAYGEVTNPKNVYLDNNCTISMYDRVEQLVQAEIDAYLAADPTKTVDEIIADKSSDIKNTVQSYVKQSGGEFDFKNSNKTLYIKSSCRFDPYSIFVPIHSDKLNTDFDLATYEIPVFMGKTTFTFKMGSDDLVVIMPASVRYSDSCRFQVDFSASPTQTVSSNNTYSVVPKTFCYFMLDCGVSGQSYNETNPAETSWDFYRCFITDQAHTNLTDFVSSKDKANNIFLLAPDNCKIKIETQNGNDGGIQAVLYSPKSQLEIQGPGTSIGFFGQALIGTLVPSQNNTQIERFLPSPNSILGYINIGSTTSNLEFNYFTNKIA